MVKYTSTALGKRSTLCSLSCWLGGLLWQRAARNLLPAGTGREEATITYPAQC